MTAVDLSGSRSMPQDSAPKVLVLGGQGRIGQGVAADLCRQTPAYLMLTGRQQWLDAAALGPRQEFLALDLEDESGLEAAIAAHDLVIHCAGPFSYRDDRVLRGCIRAGVNYLDVADNPPYIRQALNLSKAAQSAGITAIVGSGVFPGLSNSMARQGVDHLRQQGAIADHLQLSYVVAGSGGAGPTVMRTTFLELQHPIRAKLNGQWQAVAPYSQPQRVQFPDPYGTCTVYWFNTVEAMTLTDSFPLQSVVTKFGSLPGFYNPLTWLMARCPQSWIQRPQTIEFLAQVSYRMTEYTDRFSGTGIAMRLDLQGHHPDRPDHPVNYHSSFHHPDTAAAAGMGTGSIAQLLLQGDLHKPGVWPVEQALSTEQFEATLGQRGLVVETGC
jgi:saccharopine dehydrogenase-like NADP-dependent oxidoreductase